MASEKKLREIVSDIREFCEKNADPEQVERYARYFTEGYDAYGVPKDLFVEKRTELIEKYHEELPLADILRLGEMLLESGKYEEASFAVTLLPPFQDQFTGESLQELGGWLESGIRNWAHTDILCGEVLSEFFRKDVVQLEDMAQWLHSPSKWKRRAVPVTMVELVRTVDSVEPLLVFIEPIMLDEDRFVQQGVGWFLREAWKKQPKPVEAFLLKWKDTAPRKIYQYATERMTKEEKERYRRQRKG